MVNKRSVEFAQKQKLYELKMLPQKKSWIDVTLLLFSFGLNFIRKKKFEQKKNRYVLNLLKTYVRLNHIT